MKKPEPTEYPYNPQTWKKKYECKKGKGKHQWAVEYARDSSIFKLKEELVYYKCTVCGKERVEFIPWDDV